MAPLPTDECLRCEHRRSDHKIETEKTHPHFSDYQQAHPRLFKTSNREPTCHICVCTCCWFVENAEQLALPNMPLWWLKDVGRIGDWRIKPAGLIVTPVKHKS